MSEKYNYNNSPENQNSNGQYCIQERGFLLAPGRSPKHCNITPRTSIGTSFLLFSSISVQTDRGKGRISPLIEEILPMDVRGVTLQPLQRAIHMSQTYPFFDIHSTQRASGNVVQM